MTVIQLMVLLHHYSTATPWPWPSRSYDDALAKLRAAELLSKDPEVVVTPRGVVYIKMLRDTPLPVQAWADPRA